MVCSGPPSPLHERLKLFLTPIRVNSEATLCCCHYFPKGTRMVIHCVTCVRDMRVAYFSSSSTFKQYFEWQTIGVVKLLPMKIITTKTISIVTIRKGCCWLLYKNVGICCHNYCKFDYFSCSFNTNLLPFEL